MTNTAPTPGVRMRVVRSNGETANMVGLGEDLQLRIEIDQESIIYLHEKFPELKNHIHLGDILKIGVVETLSNYKTLKKFDKLLTNL